MSMNKIYNNSQFEQQELGFLNSANSNKINENDLINPKGYKGIYAFHKYWGKKPMEAISYLIQTLTKENEIVCDPFLGSGISAMEALCRNRKFIGIDINPISIYLTKLILDPPSLDEFSKAFNTIKKTTSSKINESYYNKSTNKIASHYVWNNGELSQIWIKSDSKRNKRIETSPSESDYDLFNSFKSYKCKLLRSGKFYQNSRINSSKEMTIYDLFTPRALRNIEIIMESINNYSGEVNHALKLCLTAAVGQMSNMVFIITRRGKTKGLTDSRIDVGSWVIGYWRPKLHFEINVWNCYEIRVNKLLNVLRSYKSINSINMTEKPIEVTNGTKNLSLCLDDGLKQLRSLPDRCIHCIITDPPHSDRIPYLELSEIWNLILNECPNFEDEIVISNAKDRNKTSTKYNDSMIMFTKECQRVLTDGGILALMFSSRDKSSWKFLDFVDGTQSEIIYKGFLEVNYSASSVVQDNRLGSLSDYVLIFQKNGSVEDDKIEILKKIPGWNDNRYPILRK